VPREREDGLGGTGERVLPQVRRPSPSQARARDASVVRGVRAFLAEDWRSGRAGSYLILLLSSSESSVGIELTMQRITYTENNRYVAVFQHVTAALGACIRQRPKFMMKKL
jgi:hypothetical protein